MIDWAKKHKVGLLETKTLVEMMVNHEELPLTSAQYQKVFSQTGLITTEPLLFPRQETHINALLMSKLIFTLIKESKDSFTGGVLSSKDLYFLLREDLQKDLKSLDQNELALQISNALDFLSSPFMGIIGKGKNGYFATGSQIDASQKFQYYANQIAERVQ